MTTTLSIVTPVLNGETYLDQAIQSVIGTRLQGMEYIVIDGASQDRTGEVLARYQSQLTWISETDSGPAEAVNKGWSRSTGEVVGWLNGDDLFVPGALWAVREFFDRHSHVDVLYGEANLIDSSSRITRRFDVRKPTSRRLRRRCCLCQPAVFMRRRVLDHFGMLDQRLRYWMAYEHWLRLIDGKVRIAHLDRVLASRRVHAGNRAFETNDPHRHREAFIEVIGMLTEKYGLPHANWCLQYGHAMTLTTGLRREHSTEYDRTVIRHALEAAGQSATSDYSQPLHRWRVLCKHASKEAKAILQRPKLALRFMPKLTAETIRNITGRRIFMLRRDSPTPLRLPASYYQVPQSADLPSIAIVTPNWNMGPFLERTILSVLDQDYPHLEYIVQDGGSTDQSLAIIRRYETRLASWQSIKDRGQTHAINLGFRRSRSEIMAYLNSDDLLLPGCLHYVGDYFRRHPQVDVVYGHRILVDENDMVINYWVLPTHDDKTIAWADYIPQETMFWRRSAWEAVGGLDESFQFAMDWDLILRFRAAGLKFVRLPRFLGAFRITDVQKTIQLNETIGRAESDRLRLRELGRIPSEREIRHKTRSYVKRHWWHDKWHLVRTSVQKKAA